jgi:hypothetical protein
MLVAEQVIVTTSDAVRLRHLMLTPYVLAAKEKSGERSITGPLYPWGSVTMLRAVPLQMSVS